MTRLSHAPVILALLASPAGAPAPEIPIAPDVTFVLAVADQTPAGGAPAGVLHGDYEFVVRIVEAGTGGVTQTASFDGRDAAGAQRHGSVTRLVAAADLANARVQVLGFLFDDPQTFPGTTALGPSIAVTRELVQKGEAAYSFRNWGRRDTISGTLRRTARGTVKFPVLLNGRRVELDGVHVEGMMALGTARRPFEMILLDHPTYPVSLRVAYGPRDGGFPVQPDFVREVVRIEVPTADNAVGAALGTECRAELRGIYFDFNEATIKPESALALKEIASALAAMPGRRFRLEGHTDNIGSDRYNDDLSTRRAAAVKAALARDYGVDGGRLTTAGFGERRPIETNDTLAGRARNRRVELVCADR